jgi:hypothetical protein
MTIGKRAADAANPEREDCASLEVAQPADGQALLLAEFGKPAASRREAGFMPIAAGNRDDAALAPKKAGCRGRRSTAADVASMDASPGAGPGREWTLRRPGETADLLRDVAEALRKGGYNAARLRTAIRRLIGPAVQREEAPGMEAATRRRRLH